MKPYKYYDPKNNRLIYLVQKADSTFWDQRWKTKDIRAEITGKKYDFLVLPATGKYLAPGSKILEGGCGHGTFVYSLNKAGYDCIGVDFARETIKRIKKALPVLNVRYGDLRNLNFPDNHFDGYWSIGVIEHFWKGYGQILKEMKRVVKPNGYLFLTFPYMSPLRNLKSKMGAYPPANFNHEPADFYQFALDSKNVIKSVENHGFKLIGKKPFDGFRGLQSELKFLNFLLKPIDILSNNHILGQALRFLIARTVQPFAAHSILLVFRKI